MICYHLELMLSSGTKCYHLGWKCYHLELMVSSGTKCYHLGWNVIIWSQCYHLGLHDIIWDDVLSSGANVIIWDKMLSSEANVIMVSSAANVIIWCYHVMLSSEMITPPFFVFPGNFTHSYLAALLKTSWYCPLGSKVENTVYNKKGRKFFFLSLQFFMLKNCFQNMWRVVKFWHRNIHLLLPKIFSKEGCKNWKRNGENKILNFFK